MNIEQFIEEFAKVAPNYEWDKNDRVLLAQVRGKKNPGCGSKKFIPFEIVARAKGFTEKDAMQGPCVYNWAKLLELDKEDAAQITKASTESVDRCSPTLKSYLFRAAGLL